MYGIYAEYAWNAYGMYMAYVMEYAWTVCRVCNRICMDCACDMHAMRMRHVWNIHGMCMGCVWNIAYTTCMEYAWEGIRTEQPWNNRGMTMDNHGHDPSATMHRACPCAAPNECLTKLARPRFAWEMVWDMYVIRHNM